MMNLGTLGMGALITGLVALAAAIAFTIYSFKTAVLVDDYDNPIQESTETQAYDSAC